MRLLLIVCSLFTAVSRCAARKDLEETCLSEKSCVLSCHIQEAVSAVLWSKGMLAVQWFPRSDSYHQHFRYRNRTSLFVHELHNGNCSLTINNVKPQDSGIYKCVTTSQRGEEWLFYNLSVTAPVEEVVIEQSGDVLICSSQRVHPKPECHWSGAFSNSTVQQDDQLLYSINCTTPLLHNISQYNCTVSNQFSSKRATFMQLSPITISGTEAWLRCAPSTGSVKTVSWRFNHSDIIRNLSSQQLVSERWRPFVRSISESGDLRLENLTSDQQGLFTCVTSTDTETYTATMWLEMKESMVLSVYTVIAAVLTATVLTVLALGAYRCCKTHAEALASDSQSCPTAKPQDRFHVAFLICGLLGLGSALPWHFFVTASVYFNHRMVSPIQNWFLSFTVLVSLLPHLISEGFNFFFVFRVSQQKLTSGCLFMMILFFVAMLSFIKVPMSGETLFGISMCALWLSSLFSSMVQHSLSVQVNSLPEKHRQIFTYGQASAGIVASLVMMACVAGTYDADRQVVCHFFIALVISIAAFVSYIVLRHCEFAKYHLNEERQIKQEPSFELLASNEQTINNHQEPPQSPDGLSQNWNGNLHAGFYVASVPIITFSVHPAITANVHTVYSEKWGRYFILVCCYLIFPIFHFVGQRVRFSWARKHFPIVFLFFVVVHIAFIPLFMFCNVQPRAFPYLFNDIAFGIIMVVFSLSDGFLTRLSLVYEPNSESGAGTGISNILWTALGGTIGAALSFAFRAVFYNSK